MIDGSNDLSKKNLAIAYWLSKHRHQFRKGRVFLLIAVVIIIFIIVAILGINWLVHIPQTNRIYASVGESPVRFDAVTQAQPIQIVQTDVVAHDDTSYDGVVQFRNPNTSWSATHVEFQIAVSGSEPVTDSITLAPGQDYFAVKSQIPVESGTPNIQTTITSVTWKRTPDVKIFPTPEWEFQNVHFGAIQTTEEIGPQSELTFDLVSKTVYGFREIEAVVILQDPNGAILAIGRQPISQIDSLGTEGVVIRWPKLINSNAQAVIHINTDVLTEERVIR